MQKQIMIVGGCNTQVPYFASANSPGIAVIEVDFGRGTCVELSNYDKIENPTFLTQAPGGVLVATSEMPDWSEGAVTAFHGIGETSGLRKLARQSSAGSITAFVGCDRSGQFLLVANHGWIEDLGGRDQAVAIFRIDGHDGLGDMVASARQTGSGAVLPRQERSHPHAALAMSDNRHIVVSDLGADALMVYRFDAATGRIELAHTIATAPGAGPRHMVFTHEGTRLHVDGELDSSVTSYHVNLKTGGLEELGRCRTLPSGIEGITHTSEICSAPSGRAVYVGNRGHDSLAIVDIDTADGAPLLRETVRCGGQTPRHFAVDLTGSRLAVANQDSDRVSFFAIDENDGLTELDLVLDVGTPTSVLFWDASDTTGGIQYQDRTPSSVSISR